MIKRDITETIYEYDKEGKLIKKIITETHEEEEGTTLTYPVYPTNPCNPNTNTPSNDWWKQLTAILNNLVTYTNTTTTAHN